MDKLQSQKLSDVSLGYMVWNGNDTNWYTSMLQPNTHGFQTGRIILGAANVILKVVQEPCRNHTIRLCCTNKTMLSLQHREAKLDYW